uniref:Putative ovule protein n=1 Tax=Solanum chacoense TaxID=4108 RepID=A0A0V0H7W8_SOLCH
MHITQGRKEYTVCASYTIGNISYMGFLLDEILHEACQEILFTETTSYASFLQPNLLLRTHSAHSPSNTCGGQPISFLCIL